MKTLILCVIFTLFIGCSSSLNYGDPCSDSGGPGIIGSDNSSCMTCSNGNYTSKVGGTNCSALSNGVACCTGGTSGGGGTGGCSPKTGCGLGWLNSCDGLCYSSQSNCSAAGPPQGCYSGSCRQCN